jgi:hypothetical protein
MLSGVVMHGRKNVKLKLILKFGFQRDELELSDFM